MYLAALCTTVFLPVLYFLRMSLSDRLSVSFAPGMFYAYPAPQVRFGIPRAAPAPGPHTVGRRIHSHNDYEQQYPLFEALSVGAGSVEADIWLVGGQLLVGHTQKELKPDRTLNSLYLDPLVSIIEAANRTTMGRPPGPAFATPDSAPLHLLIDIKTDGPSTFAKLYDTLEPLRRAGFLSTYHPGSARISNSLITVIGTGNTPLASVQALGSDARTGTVRDIFLDAPLDVIMRGGKDAEPYNATVSPLASVSFWSTVGLHWLVPFSDEAKNQVKAMVTAAHARGIQARFWSTPAKPALFRDHVWKLLLDAGEDWLNADDLPGAAKYIDKWEASKAKKSHH